MEIPFDEIMSAVRETRAEVGFPTLCDTAARLLPTNNWGKIRFPEVFDADVFQAAEWINESLAAFPATGVYLGLDTLNEKKGLAKTLRSACRPRLIQLAS